MTLDNLDDLEVTLMNMISEPTVGAREARARRALRRVGLFLGKSRARNEFDPSFGGYWIFDERNCVVAGCHPHPFSMSLGEVEAYVKE
ncbi:MAG: hypothetical protein ACRC67_12115 [Inquilinus sp.]|uniref:hypothetical protein n=1 Tax=Inquilinus sp. TaxID=1932117 RepID=UPI003F40A2FC